MEERDGERGRDAGTSARASVERLPGGHGDLGGPAAELQAEHEGGHPEEGGSAR